MDINLSEPQSEFFLSDSEYTAAAAGLGSGKSLVTVVRMLTTMMEYPYINMCYAAPTSSLIRDIFYPFVDKLLAETPYKHRINKSEGIVYIKGLGKIFCKTMERPELIVGFECGDFHADEIDVLTYDRAEVVFNNLCSRARQRYHDGRLNKKWLTSTPEGYKFLYHRFSKEPLTNSKLIQLSTYSNAANLPENYIASAEKRFSGPLKRAYIYGEFCNLTASSCYPDYNPDKEPKPIENSDEFTPSSLTDRVIIQQDKLLKVGCDFNVGKQIAAVAVYEDGIIKIVKEYVDMQDTPAMVDLFKELHPQNYITFYPDASGASRKTVDASKSDIVLLREIGSIDAPNKNPRIKDRVLSVNVALRKGLLKVNAKTCPSIHSSLVQMAYDKNGLPDKYSGLDHGADAVGYLVHRLMPVNVRDASFSSVMMW